MVSNAPTSEPHQAKAMRLLLSNDSFRRVVHEDKVEGEALGQSEEGVEGDFALEVVVVVGDDALTVVIRIVGRVFDFLLLGDDEFVLKKVDEGVGGANQQSADVNAHQKNDDAILIFLEDTGDVGVLEVLVDVRVEEDRTRKEEFVVGVVDEE